MTNKGHRIIEKKNESLQLLRIEYAKVTDIHPNSYNPNRQSDHDFHLLILSIHEDGFTQPVVCQRDHTIIDGEHRWTGVIVHDYLVKNKLELSLENTKAARERRLEIIDPASEIPVVFTDMTPEQMRIATLRHNRARGSEDLELSAQVLRELQALGALDWAQDSLMLDDEEINRLLEDIPAPEALAGEEYQPAWEPTTSHADELQQTSTQVYVRTQDTKSGLTEVSALSAAAVEMQRKREQQLAQAKTAEERQMIQQDNRIYRISLIFAGDEADLVKEVLGNTPAEQLIRLCKEHIHHKHQVPFEAQDQERLKASVVTVRPS